MPVSNCPFDQNKNFDFSHKKVFIPFNTDVTTVYFDSRVTAQCDIMECTHIIMVRETEWYPQSFLLALVQIKKEEESRKICDIEWTPKIRELETDIIMGDIGDVSIERVITELLVASINVWDVKVKAMESNTRHSVITPE